VEVEPQQPRVVVPTRQLVKNAVDVPMSQNGVMLWKKAFRNSKLP
jgi:hypothetical protein